MATGQSMRIYQTIFGNRANCTLIPQNVAVTKRMLVGDASVKELVKEVDLGEQKRIGNGGHGELENSVLERQVL